MPIPLPESEPVERLSTHVLDVAVGKPAQGVPVVLVRDTDQAVLGRGTTDADGRVARLNDEPIAPGDVTLTFDVDAYMSGTHGTVFHPRITVHVRLDGRRGALPPARPGRAVLPHDLSGELIASGHRPGHQPVREGRGAAGPRGPLDAAARHHRRQRHEPAVRRLHRDPPDRLQRRGHRHRHAEEHRLRARPHRGHHDDRGVRAADGAQLRRLLRAGERRAAGDRAVRLGPDRDDRRSRRRPRPRLRPRGHRDPDRRRHQARREPRP